MPNSSLGGTAGLDRPHQFGAIEADQASLSSRVFQTERQKPRAIALFIGEYILINKPNKQQL
jgi:hypothetical protein